MTAYLVLKMMQKCIQLDGWEYGSLMTAASITVTNSIMHSQKMKTLIDANMNKPGNTTKLQP